MRLQDLVETSKRVAATRRRLEKTASLAACLRAAGPGDIEVAASFLVGVPRQGRIGVGWATLEKVLAAVPAASSPELSLAEVDATLDRLAATKRSGAASGRREPLMVLFARATAEERQFLVRLLIGELRQGALEGLMVEAIAEAGGLPSDAVRRAVMLAGDVVAVAKVALIEGAAGLDRFAVQPFRPLKPMLAQSAADTDEALEALGEAVLDYKLDGARIQVHKADGEIRVYTRKLNEVTAAVPEVVEAMEGLPQERLILDGEVLALRPDGRPQPFQVTMRRFGRKLDVDRARQSLPLHPYFFDCLLLDGETLIDRTSTARFDAMAAGLPEGLIIPRTRTGDAETAATFLRQSLAHGHEGIMAKALDAPYEAGARGAGWLKIKQVHTLDLVVLAAEWGHGRRRGWLSNLHLGARDPDAGGFVMLGKTFKGLTDKVLAWQTEKLQELEITRDRHVVHVRPELVVEIAFNEIQESSQYPGGLALRFARVKRYRPDKQAAEADTIETVRAIHTAVLTDSAA